LPGLEKKKIGKNKAFHVMSAMLMNLNHFSLAKIQNINIQVFVFCFNIHS